MSENSSGNKPSWERYVDGYTPGKAYETPPVPTGPALGSKKLSVENRDALDALIEDSVKGTPSGTQAKFLMSPQYARMMAKALVSGKELDFEGAWVPDDIQEILSQGRAYVDERMTFVERCLLISRMLAELRNPKISPHAEMILQVLKVGEEFGEASQAMINATGQNFRKGKVGTMENVADELLDTAVTALVSAATVLSTSFGWSDHDIRDMVNKKIKFLYGRIEKAVLEKGSDSGA